MGCRFISARSASQRAAHRTAILTWIATGRAGGEPQIQDYLSLFLTAVNEGKLSLDTFGKNFCLQHRDVYPKKGVLLPGSDADMVIVDMNKKEVISNETTYTNVGWTPYHGRKVKGVPIRTILRGKTVMQDGKITGKPGDGVHVKPLG